MIQDYYKTQERTTANSATFDVTKTPKEPFPRDGFYVGEYESSSGIRVPALIPIDRTNGICFLSTKENDGYIKNLIQYLTLRIVLSLPAGLCKLTLYDPVNMGKGLIVLSGLDSSIKGDAIITDKNEFKKKLIEIAASIPRTVQQVLGMKYQGKTLINYNEDAGELAKPIHFIVLTDVPNGIDKESGELLSKIIKEGGQAGVFVLLKIDTSVNLSENTAFSPLSLLDQIATIYEKDARFYIKGIPGNDIVSKFQLIPQTEFPSLEETSVIIDSINERLKTASIAAVSLAGKFTKNNLWAKDSRYGIDIPVGKKNSTDIQHFQLGIEDSLDQTCHHCLIGGSTGSGKTILLHNIICNTAWMYSPSEVQFLLLDFKEGTEFNVYRDLPHVKVLLVQSEVEFAESVFVFLEDEIKQRAEKFKAVDKANVRSFRDAANEKMPRYILIIDEFQKLFDGDMRTAE